MNKKKNPSYIPAPAKTAAQRKADSKRHERTITTESLSVEAQALLMKKRVWTLSIISLCLILVLTLSIGFATYVKQFNSELTNKTPDEITDEEIVKNSEFNFSKYTSELVQYPHLPTNWQVSSSGKALTETVSGVISRDSEKTAKVRKDLAGLNVPESAINTALSISDTENTITMDKDLLLLYNKVASVSSATSTSFTISSNSYLKITIRVKTSVETGGAYIGYKTTTSASTAFEKEFKGINTNGEWVNYEFIIEGSKTSSKTVYLFLGLGEENDKVSGLAVFDFAKAELSKKATYIEFADANTDTLKTVSYATEKKGDNLFDATTFGAMVDESNNNLAPISGAALTELGDLPFYDAENLNIYSVDNKTANVKTSKYMKFNGKFNVKQSTATPHYRISFWAKTTDIQNNTGAFFYMGVYDKDGVRKDTLTKSFSLVKTSTETDDVNDGWAEYSFLIQPSNNNVFSVDMVFSLGELQITNDGSMIPVDSELQTTGKLYVTEFDLREIYQSEYSSASDGDNLKKLSLGTSTSSGMIENGNFDNPISNSYSSEAASQTGFDPNSWKVSFPKYKDADGNLKYVPYESSDLSFGIVAKNGTNKGDYLPSGNMDSYFGHVGSDNILAAHAKVPTAVGFVSNKFTLEANKYYILSVLVKAENTKNVNIYLTGDIKKSYKIGDMNKDETKYFKQEVDGSIGTYYRYNIVVATGDKSKSVAMELWLGSKDASFKDGAWTGLADANSYAAFDEAKTETLTEDQYKEIVNKKATDGTAIFDKEVKKGEDADGEEIDIDIVYTTTRENIIVEDFTKEDVVVADDEETVDPVQPLAPVDWLLLSSLIMSIAVIIFMITIIVKKFKRNKKAQAYQNNDDYKL